MIFCVLVEVFYDSSFYDVFILHLQQFNLIDYFSKLVGIKIVELIKYYPDGFYYIHWWEKKACRMTDLVKKMMVELED